MNRREFTKSVALSAIALPFVQHKMAGQFTVDELMGRSNITLVGRSQLRAEASKAFDKMALAASKEGIEIAVASSYRSYTRQEQIWTRKYDRLTKRGMSPEKVINKIIEYSTIPGTSRHHWGTDIDIIQGGKAKQQDSLLARHFEPGGLYRKLKVWLDKNKESFGFYEVYTQDPNRKGFSYEPWHLSYKPLSYAMLKEYRDIDLKAFLQKIKLKGSEHFSETFITCYRAENVLDINPDLL